MNGLCEAERVHERKRREDLGNLLDEADKAWLESRSAFVIREGVTDREIDELIECIAETGHYEDELGRQVKAGPLITALAIDWMDDRQRIPGNTNVAFRSWATRAAALRRFGK
jgi:hypothetical protein